MSLIKVTSKSKGTANVRGIHSLFEPGGAINREAQVTAKNLLTRCVLTAPHRTGHLATKHSKHVYPFFLRTNITISNKADYAYYVHEGTTGPIWATHSERLWIRPFPHSDYERRHPRWFVRGQESQPWMSDAMKRVVDLKYHI